LANRRKWTDILSPSTSATAAGKFRPIRATVVVRYRGLDRCDDAVQAPQGRTGTLADAQTSAPRRNVRQWRPGRFVQVRAIGYSNDIRR